MKYLCILYWRNCDKKSENTKTQTIIYFSFHDESPLFTAVKLFDKHNYDYDNLISTEVKIINKKSQFHPKENTRFTYAIPSKSLFFKWRPFYRLETSEIYLLSAF